MRLLVHCSIVTTKYFSISIEISFYCTCFEIYDFGFQIELLLRKIFSSLGLLWEDHDDAMTAMSGSSLASSSITAEQNDRVRSDAELDGRYATSYHQ